MAIAGFTAPSAGAFLLDGAKITGLPPEKCGFGMVPCAVLPMLAGMREIDPRLLAAARGMGPAWRRLCTG